MVLFSFFHSFFLLFSFYSLLLAYNRCAGYLPNEGFCELEYLTSLLGGAYFATKLTFSAEINKPSTTFITRKSRKRLCEKLYFWLILTSLS